MTLTSCFVYKVIRDVKSKGHLCINPTQDRINTQVIYRFGLLKWSVHVSVLLSDCKQIITSLSLLIGTTVHGLGKSYCHCIQAQPFSLTGIYHYDKDVLARLICI